MCAARRSWTDEIFSLFVEGRLGSLSARQVCQVVDWISAQPALVEQLHSTEGFLRETRLAALVNARARRGLSRSCE